MDVSIKLKKNIDITYTIHIVWSFAKSVPICYIHRSTKTIRTNWSIIAGIADISTERLLWKDTVYYRPSWISENKNWTISLINIRKWTRACLESILWNAWMKGVRRIWRKVLINRKSYIWDMTTTIWNMRIYVLNATMYGKPTIKDR
jgi:hypothetical protein